MKHSARKQLSSQQGRRRQFNLIKERSKDGNAVVVEVLARVLVAVHARTRSTG